MANVSPILTKQMYKVYDNELLVRRNATYSHSDEKCYHNYCNKFLLFSYLSFSFKNAALKNECSILHNYIVYGHILTTMHLKEKKIPRNTYRDDAVVFCFLIHKMKPTIINIEKNPVFTHFFNIVNPFDFLNI